MRSRPAALLVASLLSGTAAPSAAPAPAAYRAEIETWRAERVERLRGESGWLTLVGLYWLEPGETRFGSAKDAPVRLAAPGVPADAGAFVREGTTVRLVPRSKAVLIDGAPATARALKTDADGKPDVLRVGRLSMTVIRRGDRVGVRVRDPQAPTRTAFKGIPAFPVDPAYRIEARFVRFDEPREIAVPTAIGTSETARVPGELRFEIDGREVALLGFATDDPPSSFFVVFNDGTSGAETYGAGRFLDADGPKDGVVVLDFNRAYNPPCAFTPYATCPLPPRENRLDVRIPAGEKKVGEH